MKTDLWQEIFANYSEPCEYFSHANNSCFTVSMNIKRFDCSVTVHQMIQHANYRTVWHTLCLGICNVQSLIMNKQEFVKKKNYIPSMEFISHNIHGIVYLNVFKTNYPGKLLPVLALLEWICTVFITWGIKCLTGSSAYSSL